MFRTPAKTTQGSSEEIESPHLTAGSVEDAAELPRPNVRRSIGEWESGKPESRTSLTPTNRTFAVGSPNPKPTASRRRSVEVSASPPRRSAKASERILEAKACVTKAKLNLSNSRNLKTEIKAGVTQAIDRLFQLVKEAEQSKGHTVTARPKNQAQERSSDIASSSSPPNSCLEEMMRSHMDLIQKNSAQMRSLNKVLEQKTVIGGRENLEGFDNLVSEVRELRRIAEATEGKVSSLRDTVPSYAEVLARPTGAATPSKLRAKHSVIVSSVNEMDTSEEVLGQVRDILKAKTNGLQLTRVQKVRHQKVVLSCATQAELKKVTERITAHNKTLSVEEAKNKDPLIILKNLLTFNKDEDIVASLKTQNTGLLDDLGENEFRAVVKYRRRARNPHENHVVLQVSPQLWLRLTQAKRVHVDLQFVAVHDQSPLVQCTRCLGYGHGRRLCKEPADICSYCAGPHLRANCPAYLTGESAVCRNCRSAKHDDVSHNAFDGECPVRKRWDAIARSSVAYC